MPDIGNRQLSIEPAAKFADRNCDLIYFVTTNSSPGASMKYAIRLFCAAEGKKKIGRPGKHLRSVVQGKGVHPDLHRKP